LTICGGAVTVFSSQRAFSLQIAYRATFSFIAIVLGIALFYTGYSFAQLLKKMTGVPKSKRYEILIVSMIGSAGLICQAIDLLIVTAAQVVQSNYVSLSILIIVEIIPATVFLILVDIKGDVKNQMASSVKSGGSKTNNDDDDIILNIPYKD